MNYSKCNYTDKWNNTWEDNSVISEKIIAIISEETTAIMPEESWRVTVNFFAVKAITRIAM